MRVRMSVDVYEYLSHISTGIKHVQIKFTLPKTVVLKVLYGGSVESLLQNMWKKRYKVNNYISAFYCLLST